MLMPSNLERLASNMHRRKLNGHRLYCLLLMPFTQAGTLQEGYHHLVWLLQEGYFATIVTLNNDTQLEDIISGEGLQAIVLETGKNTTQSIVDALEDPPHGICIIKLHHSANNEHNDDLSSLTRELQNGLKSYMQNAIVIVDSLHHNRILTQIIQNITIKSIFHVLPPPPPHTTTINAPEIFPIYKDFTLFFASLASLMKEQSSAPKHQSQETGSEKPHRVPSEQKTNIAQKGYSFETQKSHSLPLHGSKTAHGVQHKSKLQADILLATVTPIETQAVLQLFPEHQVVRIRKKIYYDLGSISGARIVLVQQPHMGSSGVAGSHVSIKEAIHALSPIYVIMIGIAFGTNSDKQHIGDILVSRHIQDYDPQRVSLGPNKNPIIEARGDRVMASPELLDLFMAGQYSLPNIWTGKPPDVHFGTILSGSKLVDHLDYRDELRSIAPDAIGGEMEGIGLYYAAIDRNRKVHWLLVKGISDWADGNKNTEKNDRQQLAASNAARFTHHVLQRGGFEHHRTKKRTQG